ncbi:MAG: ribokinase [Oscillospiraceae bacterium]|nr:ribokinase [Oscillospiraceae bacterium]
MKVLCFGSLNIDYVYRVPHFVARGETLASAALEVFSGGKGLNQSVALARAGAKVLHAGAIGAEGRFLLEELAAAGVDTALVEVLDGVRTGHAVIQRDESGDNCILLYGGANRAITREQIDRTLARFSAGDVLLLQNEISEGLYAARRAGERGMRVVLNPSPMEESLLPLFALADTLLLNEVEAAQFLGLPADAAPELLIDGLRRRLPETELVLTLGARGAVYACGDTLLCQRAFPVRAVDTTAAGDTFTGFFLASRLSGADAPAALRLASAAAALAVTRPGAAPSIPTRGEAEAFLSRAEADC